MRATYDELGPHLEYVDAIMGQDSVGHGRGKNEVRMRSLLNHNRYLATQANGESTLTTWVIACSYSATNTHQWSPRLPMEHSWAIEGSSDHNQIVTTRALTNVGDASHHCLIHPKYVQIVINGRIALCDSYGHQMIASYINPSRYDLPFTRLHPCLKATNRDARGLFLS